MNITLLGLKGSGKTCFLYMSTRLLYKGLDIDGHKIYAKSKNYQQQAFLNSGVETMVCDKKWPDNSLNTSEYSFNFEIDGIEIFPFTIFDYKGGILKSIDNEDDVDSAREIFSTYNESSCIVVLIDGDTVMGALYPEEKVIEKNQYIDDEDEKLSPYAVKMQAENDLIYIESLVKECRKYTNKNVPILLTITKSDMFTSDELSEARSLLKNLLPFLFSANNDMIVGITDVSIGKNLSNQNGKLRGSLCHGVESNLHLPILFSIFQNSDEIREKYEELPILRTIIRRCICSNRINLYRGGKEAMMIF